MSKRVERRRRIEAAFEDFRRAVEQALTVASREQTGAAREHARTMVASWLRAEGIDNALTDPVFAAPRANPDMADVFAEARADRDRHFEKWTADGPRALAELVREAAPGAAGAPWQQWLGTIGTADGTSAVPELWRIGTAIADSAPEPVAFPVAVPLLDAAHLHVSTTTETRAAAEAMIEALLLRVLSYFQPGLVHLHLWDIGQLTGPLPGLYPLTRAGLLTVHNPARPQELLDELSEHIRRVHGGLLGGGQTTLRAVRRQSGRRGEPWRIAVLFGNRQQLPDDQQQQLQRVARNGLPCGVQLILVDIPVTVNSPEQTGFAADVARAVAGPAQVDDESDGTMGGEDFAYMLEARPGAYIFIGNGSSTALHTDTYDFDDEALPYGVSYWARLVEMALPAGA